MKEKIIKIVLGVMAGFVFGFFSTGGGSILLPGFMYGLKMKSEKARATTICCTLIIALISSVFYYTKNSIDWKIGIMCGIGGIIGGIIGAKIVKKISEKYLKIVFVVLLMYISFKMIL